MRRVHVAFTAIAALFVVASCAEYVPHQHMHENWYRRHENSVNPVPVSSKDCDGSTCQRVLHFDRNCEPSDENGQLLKVIYAKIGTHICIYNDNNCQLVIHCGDVLFGPNNRKITIEPGHCVTMIVSAAARNQTITLLQGCKCLPGRVHTNPDVKVGNDEEPGG